MNIRINKRMFRIRNCKDEDYRFVYNLTKRNMYDLFVKNRGAWDPKRFRSEFDRRQVDILNRAETLTDRNQ